MANLLQNDRLRRAAGVGQRPQVSSLPRRRVNQRRALAGDEVGVDAGAGIGTRIEAGHEGDVHGKSSERTPSGTVIDGIDGTTKPTTIIRVPDSVVSAEPFTPDERRALAPYFTNLDRPVFALTNLPEVVKGALFARYSRSAKSVRRLFLDEFLDSEE